MNFSLVLKHCRFVSQRSTWRANFNWGQGSLRRPLSTFARSAVAGCTHFMHSCPSAHPVPSWMATLPIFLVFSSSFLEKVRQTFSGSSEYFFAEKRGNYRSVILIFFLACGGSLRHDWKLSTSCIFFCGFFRLSVCLSRLQNYMLVFFVFFDSFQCTEKNFFLLPRPFIFMDFSSIFPIFLDVFFFSAPSVSSFLLYSEMFFSKWNMMFDMFWRETENTLPDYLHPTAPKVLKYTTDLYEKLHFDQHHWQKCQGSFSQGRTFERKSLRPEISQGCSEAAGHHLGRGKDDPACPWVSGCGRWVAGSVEAVKVYQHFMSFLSCVT